MMTRPVPPSIVITSPSSSLWPPIRSVFAPASISRPSLPATHGLPIPRATTAACEVMPPCAVRTPCAWISPWMSSGVVSQRTRITDSPALPRSAALSASRTIFPDAAPGDALRPCAGDLERRVRVEARMEELVELARVDPRDRLVPLDQPFRRHVDGALDRGRRRALRRARLQEVEASLLDRELDVLHVAVVALERGHGLEQLVVRVGHALAQVGERLRRAGAGDDVLALRVDEVLAVDALLAGRGVAREATPVAESSPLLPKTIWTTLTAVPRSSGIEYMRR